MSVANDPTAVTTLLTTPGRWAIVGLSTNTSRAAYSVAAYLQQLGHTVIPVHPKAQTVHGETGYPNLTRVPGPIDVVDVFVNSTLAGTVIDEAIAVGAPAIWLQPDITDPEAEQRARDAGITLIIDTCPLIEGPRAGARPRPQP